MNLEGKIKTVRILPFLLEINAASCIESASTDAFAAVSGYEEKIAEVNRSVDRIFGPIEKINIYRKELFFETGDIIPVQDILSLDISECTCDI